MAETIKQAVAPATPKKTSVAKPQKTMKDYVQAMMPEVQKVLPQVMTPEKFTRLTLNALSTTPKLAETTPKSFLAAMMNAAQCGLEPNTPLGQAYLIPYMNHGTLETQYQIGYKGLLDLAHRNGTNVQAHEVYEGDKFEYSYGLEPNLVHVPAMENRGKVIAYYAIWKNGKDFGFEVMSVEDIKNHAKKFSKAFSSSSSPWTSNFDEMAKKTVIKKVLKYAPLSVEVQRALSADETIKTDLSKDMYTVKDETDYTQFVADEETGEVIDAEVVSE